MDTLGSSGLKQSKPLGWETPFRTNTKCCRLCTACVWEMSVWSGPVCNMWSSCQECISLKQRGSTHTLEQTRWSHSKATPHTLGDSQLVWHQTICGPVYPRELRWSCGSVCVCVCACACVLNIVFHLDLKAWKTSIPIERWGWLRTRIVSLVQSDPVNYSSAHTGKWTGLDS